MDLLLVDEYVLLLMKLEMTWAASQLLLADQEKLVNQLMHYFFTSGDGTNRGIMHRKVVIYPHFKETLVFELSGGVLQ